MTQPCVEVAEHDVVTDNVPKSVDDLAHARFVLIHLPDAVDVLATLTTALNRAVGWSSRTTNARWRPPDHPWATVARPPGRLVDERGGDGNVGARCPASCVRAGWPMSTPKTWSSPSTGAADQLAATVRTAAPTDPAVRAGHDGRIRRGDRGGPRRRQDLVGYGPMLVSARDRKTLDHPATKGAHEPV